MDPVPVRSAAHGPIRIHLVEPRDAILHSTHLLAIAVAAFAGPPWYEDPATAAGTVVRLLHDSRAAQFVLVLALDGDRTCGFAYGVADRTLETLARVPAAPLVPFELRELAVDPAARGKGTGAALHDAIVTTSPGPRWLTTHPGAHRAVTLYRTRGWRSVRLVPSRIDGTPRVLMHRTA
jgi:GNAT superfamily N-acetyltransferase